MPCQPSLHILDIGAKSQCPKDICRVPIADLMDVLNVLGIKLPKIAGNFYAISESRIDAEST
jgi:hypothetical protein